jgi:hypothetical protein
LELLAIADGRLLRKYWTPDRGFVDAGTIRDGVRSCSAFVECGDGRAAVLVTDVDGRVRLLRADLRTYPELSWQDSELPTPRADAVSLVEVPAAGLVAAITAGNRAFVIRAADGDWARRADVPGSWRDVALVGAPVVRLVGVAAPSTLDGGRLELVLAGPPGLHHGWAPLLPDGGLGRWSDPELVRARYWVEDDPE